MSGYLGYQAYRSHQEQQQRELFVQGARQGALNLTTIDWQTADADVQRILDSATGTFYDDFSNRSQPFIDVVRQTQSKSVGTITEAGLESSSGEQAQVLVAVTVNISNAAGPAARSARMADADHDAEGGRRGEGLECGVRAVMRTATRSQDTEHGLWDERVKGRPTVTVDDDIEIETIGADERLGGRHRFRSRRQRETRGGDGGRP